MAGKASTGTTRLRPVDLAREHGLSGQAVRNYEEAGILPAAERTEHGYRIYRPRHALALRAFVALLPAFGHGAASAVLRAVHADALDEAFAIIDDGHGQLRTDRATLAAVTSALTDLTAADPTYREMFVGDLAHRLRVRPATLRNWERAGLLRPRRDRATGYRVYSAADVRDAHLAHQLRRGGYPLARIAPLLAQVRSAGGIEPLRESLDDWQHRLTRRGLAMLAGAAALHAYVAQYGTPGAGAVPAVPAGNSLDGVAPAHLR